MTDEVAEQVLRNNYLQSQAISLLEQRSVADLGDHQQLLRLLERDGDLNRALEFLPSDSDIEERMVRGRGLTRPELAVLLAYGKIALNHALTEADIAADPYLAGELERYFPQRWRRRFAARIAHHRLRSELIATATTNSILNRMDPGFVTRMASQTGATTAAVARAYTIARDSAGLRGLWMAIEALDNRAPPVAQYEALLATRDYVEQLTRRLLLARSAGGDRPISGPRWRGCPRHSTTMEQAAARRPARHRRRALSRAVCAAGGRGTAARTGRPARRARGAARHAGSGRDCQRIAPPIAYGSNAVLSDRCRIGHRLAGRSDPPAAHFRQLAGGGARAPVHGLPRWTA